MSAIRSRRWSALAAVFLILLSLTGAPVAAKVVSDASTPVRPAASPALPGSDAETQLAMVSWGQPLSEDEMERITGGVSPVLLGAGIGALSGGISYGLNALRSGEWDWQEFAAGVGSGAVGGATAGLIPGSSTLAQTARRVTATVVGTVSSWVADWFGW